MVKDYFTRADGSDELACSCGCGLTVRKSTRDKLNLVRRLLGEPMRVWGARCSNNPAYSGKGSSHGDRTDDGGAEPCAIDIAEESKYKRKRILELAIEVGFMRWGLGESKLHIDDDETKVESYWIYS